MRRIAVLCVMMLGFSVQMAIADIPGTINFQGRLTDTVGNAVTNGTYGVTFTLHYLESGNSPTGWSEVQLVSTKSGYFNIALGSVTPLNSLNFDYLYYLDIHVEGDAQSMSPRQPLSSVPYAMRAQNANTLANGAVKTATIEDGAITSIKIANGTITSADVAGATITGSNIASGTITAGNIANSTITGGKIAGATITSTNIANGAIDTQAKASWAPVVWKYGTMSGNYSKIIYGQTTSDAGAGFSIDISSYGFSEAPIFVATVYSTVALVFGNATTSSVNGSTHTSGGAPLGGVSFNWIIVGR